MTGLFEDQAGHIWIGSFDGLTRFDGRSFTLFLSPSLSYYFARDRDGNMLLSHSEANPSYYNTPCQVLYRYDGQYFTKVVEK